MRKTGEGDSSFSFYTPRNYYFPSKNGCSKVRDLFKMIDMCQQRGDPKSLTKVVGKKKKNKGNYLYRKGENA